MTRSSLSVALAAVCLAVTLWLAFARIRIPFELNYEEGNILNASVRLLRGATPYPDPGSFPYLLNPYGPVGYLFTALGIRLFGLSLFSPRLLVLLSAVAIGFLIAALTKHSGGRWNAGFLLGALYLAAPVARAWLPLLRVDFWAILLSLLALYFFLAFPRLRFVVPFVCGLALLTKPTAVAAPVACLLELVRQRQGRRAAVFGAGLAATVLVPAVFLGRPFLFHLFATHPDPFRWGHALDLYLDGLQGALLPVALIVYAVATGFRGKSASLVWFYLAACSVTALSAGKLGSDSNHLLEWSAAVFLCGALALSHLLATRDSLAPVFHLGAVLLLVFFTVQARRTFAPRPDQRECRDAYAFVQSFPGDQILSEDVASLVLSGKPVLVSNPFVATQLGNSVQWSRGSLERLVQEQYFELILLGGDLQAFDPASGRWSPGLIRAVGERYQPARQFACFPYLGAAYVPKATLTPALADR